MADLLYRSPFQVSQPSAGSEGLTGGATPYGPTMASSPFKPFWQQSGDQAGQPRQLPARPPGGATTAAPQSMTFAQMRGAGIARPPMPRPQMAPGYQRTASPYQGQLNATIGQSLANPSAYTSDVVQSTFNRLAGQIDDQYAQEKRGVDNEMAGRGFFDSTMAGGKLHDLNIAKRDARTTLADTLLERQAQQYATDRATAVQQALAAQSQEAGQDLAAYSANLQALGLNNDAQQALAALGLSYDQLGEQGRQFDATNALNQQRLGLDAELGRGNLALGQQRMGLDAELGRGNLSLDRDRLTQEGALGNRRIDVDKEISQNNNMIAILNALNGLGLLGASGGGTTVNIGSSGAPGVDVVQGWQGLPGATHTGSWYEPTDTSRTNPMGGTNTPKPVPGPGLEVFNGGMLNSYLNPQYAGAGAADFQAFTRPQAPTLLASQAATTADPSAEMNRQMGYLVDQWAKGNQFATAQQMPAGWQQSAVAQDAASGGAGIEAQVKQIMGARYPIVNGQYRDDSVALQMAERLRQMIAHGQIPYAGGV